MREFVHIRTWRRRLIDAYYTGIRRTCRNECRSVPRPDIEKCVEECVERKRDEAQRLAREIAWYETKMNFITPRSLRVFDNATGYYIICYVTRRNRVVCMSWDPGTFEFKRKVDIIYSCAYVTSSYCSRSDRHRNIHVEAEACEMVNVDELPADLVEAMKVLESSFEPARDRVEDCLECFGMHEEIIAEGYSTISEEICAYNRCDESWRICDVTTCTCKRVDVEPLRIEVE